MDLRPRELRLEPFDAGDVERLLRWIPDERALVQWAGPAFAPPLDAARLHAHLETARADGTRELWKGVDPERAETVAHVELGGIDRRQRVARMGRVLVDPAQRGRGYGEAIVRAALGRAFDGLGLHRVDLGVYAWNRPALSLYERLGFQREGVRREVVEVAGERWDSVEMALLRPEWEALRER